MEIDVSLLNLVVMEFMFGTLKSSLPRLWNLGIFCATRRKMMAKSQKTVSKLCCWKAFYYLLHKVSQLPF